MPSSQRKATAIVTSGDHVDPHLGQLQPVSWFDFNDFATRQRTKQVGGTTRHDDRRF